ncbi:hypothetical protein C0Q70_08103 [Pomacea canaliculata]|uniref:Uncharacterized protein n=1 Tax=Pomacea canaliculata TaxID=400727 RepID=A0A2T7PGX3_POMCA|nr:hypothetical protein C0Q70_08103 [Pomacea canaliculata]
MFCYYSSDAQYRLSVGRFLPENIDPTLCTHVIFAFFQPNGLDVQAVGARDLVDYSGGPGLYQRTVALKKKNPRLRVLLAIGGWVIGSKALPPDHSVCQYHTTIHQQRYSLSQHMVQRSHNMDGMDMDWEFPGVRGSTPDDRPLFTLLLKTLQEEFTREAIQTGREKLILTLATAAGSYYIDQGYETREIAKYPDYMLLMTYNYHGSWENKTGHPSAVWASYLDQGDRRELCMNWTTQYWLSQGAPREKLILGLATYGMTYTLVNPAINGLMAPAYGGGRGAQYTQEYGIMAFYEVCENLARHGWRSVWIEDQKVPYAYGGDQWVGYDNVDSITIKVQQIINRYDLGGAFVWSVEMDDFSNHCGYGPYPLLRAIKTTMDGGYVGQTVTTPRPLVPFIPFTATPPPFNLFTTRQPYIPRPSTYILNPTPQPQTPHYPANQPSMDTMSKPVMVFPSTDCKRLGQGIFADPTACGQFFYCVEALQGHFFQYTMRCPRLLKFDAVLLTVTLCAIHHVSLRTGARGQ